MTTTTVRRQCTSQLDSCGRKYACQRRAAAKYGFLLCGDCASWMPAKVAAIAKAWAAAPALTADEFYRAVANRVAI
jgi:hypothetical protein